MARCSSMSFLEYPTTTEPSWLAASALEFLLEYFELSVVNVPRSVWLAQLLPDQTTACMSSVSLTYASPTTTEPSPLTPYAAELRLMSLLCAKLRLVLVLQPLPDQTTALLLPSTLSPSADPTTTEPSSLTALALAHPELSALSVPRAVLVPQPLPDQTTARRSLLPTTVRPLALMADAPELPELSLFNGPRSVMLLGAAAAGSAASSAARVKRRCAGDDLRIVMFSLFRL